jgi:hypothetical protein
MRGCFPLSCSPVPLLPFFFLDFPRRSVPNSAGIPSTSGDSKQVLNEIPPSEATVLLNGIFRTRKVDDVLSALGEEENAICEC